MQNEIQSPAQKRGKYIRDVAGGQKAPWSIFQPIHFPNITCFRSFFACAEYYSPSMKDMGKFKYIHLEEPRQPFFKISPCLTITDHPDGAKFMKVVPEEFLESWLRNNMTRVDYDTLNFKLTIHPENECALLSVQHNQILGICGSVISIPRRFQRKTNEQRNCS